MSHTLPQWAPRVKQHRIRRLYETDARGICDEELIDEVGYALSARCASFIAAVQATRGHAACPDCGAVVEHDKQPDAILRCVCGWELAWQDYFRTIQHRQLSGAEPVLALFQSYVQRFAAAKTPRTKMLLIDEVIHGFHVNLVRQYHGSTRAACVNLIEGNLREVMQFLDALTYGEGNAPEMQQRYAEWRETVSDMNEVMAQWRTTRAKEE